INLPEQNESLNWLNFSPVEYHFYRRQYEDCSRSALKELKKFQESETELNSLDRYSVHRVLWPLLRLRQACCHPQAVRGGYLAVQKTVITMDQLLESLINKAKNESQDAHRQLLCALNGLAGTYILQENWQNAVDVYREAMASWKEHEELFKTDSLQKLHTLHNLHDVLSKFDSNTRTLADDFLQQKASEIRDKYLQKWKDQVTVAENETSSARQAHDELKHKVDLKCPWWMTYLQDIIDRKNPGDEIVSERLVDKVKSDLTAVRNVQEFGYLSMADSFSDLRGLQLLLVRKFEAIEECRNSLFIELKSLMVEPTKEMVVSAAECCLRPAVNSTAESCCFCRTNDVMSVYESLIFGHQGIKNTDAESIGGLRAETEAVRTLKSIFAFLKSESKRHYKYHIELQQEAQCHLECLDLMKKNFKVYRQLWHALRQRVSALDELAMCTMRLRLKYRGEVVPDNQFYIVHPAEVGTTQMGFRSDKTIANSSLRKCLGQLLYLKNLAKTQSTDGGENSELCPVCTKVLGYEWSVFSCGHCLCCQCMWVLLERPDIPGRAGSNVRCPMCRANTMVQDISYVSTIRQLTEQDKDLVVKGSHSTKIEAAVRTLMRIQRTDPLAKTLVFSTWQDVLDVISRALVENNMKFRSIKKSKDYESSLEEFKTSDDIPILLIPLQSGSNGLNIIEATHVILVEPSLNPSLERQAVGRIHRIGQTKPTFIHRLLIANTVEEKIMRFLQNKTETGLRCGTRRTDGENVPLTVGELTSFFQPTESQPM
ncbi:E3 ubiquitin- ligase SHPRH, partial [Paramuricea clavata]